jgi:single-strand DNA-binding protein
MASRSVNKVILLGNLGKDAETKFTTSGTAKTTFTLATSRRWKDQQSGEWKEETEWHNLVMWKAENVATYLTKGKKVYIEGRIQTRNYEDKDGQKRYFTDIVVEELVLLGGDREASGAGPGEYNQQAQPVSMPRTARGPQPMPAHAPAAEEPGMNQAITDDDVPF